MLKTLANDIGSDFRLFFYNQGFVKNLKTIKTNKKNYKFYFLLVFSKNKMLNKKCLFKSEYFFKKT